MEHVTGLRILSISSGYNSYVIVAWVKRDGDELLCHGARVIRHFGYHLNQAELAANGPDDDTQMFPPSEQPEEVYRPCVSRSIPCNVEAWATECPKPEGFE